MAELTQFVATYAAHRDDLTAASLAFYVSLALAPAAIALGAIASLVLTPEAVSQALSGTVSEIPDTLAGLKPLADSLVAMVERASATSFTFTTIIGIAVAVYASSRFVYVLRLGLDVVAETQSAHQGIVSRLWSALFTLAALIVAAIVMVLWYVLPKVVSEQFVNVLTEFVVLDWIVMIVLMYLAVLLVFRFGPHQRVRVPWLSAGTLFTTAWFVIGSLLIGVYVSWSTTLGNAVALLGFGIGFIFWLYIMFLGLFLGAELNQAVRSGLWQRVRG